MIKKILCMLFPLMLFSGMAQAETMTAKEAVDLLAPSVFQLKQKNKFICTATMISPTQLLTARHCVLRIKHEHKAEQGLKTFFIRSVHVSLQKVKDRSGYEDWAVLELVEKKSDIPYLTIGCEEEVYVGMPVAYYGNPSPLKSVFGMGYISTLETKTTVREKTPFDITTSIRLGPGASGSALISLDTGNIIGIISHTVTTRGGLLGSGVQSVKHMDHCENIRNAGTVVKFRPEISFQNLEKDALGGTPF